jgi:hypothetical protein
MVILAELPARDRSFYRRSFGSIVSEEITLSQRSVFRLIVHVLPATKE